MNEFVLGDNNLSPFSFKNFLNFQIPVSKCCVLALISFPVRRRATQGGKFTVLLVTLALKEMRIQLFLG